MNTWQKVSQSSGSWRANKKGEHERTEALEWKEASRYRKRSKNRKQEGTGGTVAYGCDVLGHAQRICVS